MLRSQNEWFGFFGAMGKAADDAWSLALPLIVTATGCEEEDVRHFLDSRHGRQFADTVHSYLGRGRDLEQAVAEAIAEWQEYRVGKATRRAYGIPEGADYLTGMILSGAC